MTADPGELLAARSLMAFTLGSHIILVPLGVAFPALVLIANFIGLKRNDPVALILAQRWSHIMAVLFAVGAVSGTVLSFEMGLLWPGLTGVFGDVYGLPFSVEGIFFFLEAIFITIYIYGWKHLSPWTHFWLGMVLPFVALGGVFSIISANGWMNAPSGFSLGADGRPTNVDPIAAIFNQAVAYEFPHMLAAAYMTAGFLIAGVFAVARLRGNWGRYQRLAFAIPFTVAAIVAPLQMLIGDTVARTVFQEMPIKFAAIEIVWTTGADEPEIILGRLNLETGVVEGGLPIPGMASWLSGFSTSTVITGLSTVARDEQPPANIVHWAWDGMVFGGTGAVVAEVLAGIIAVVGIFVLRADDAFLFQGLAERGWPLLLLSGVTGIAALIILRRGARHATRALGALAVASVIWGWGVAQYPYLLPQSLTISAGAGAPATLQWLVVVVVAALLLVVPSLLFVFRLDQQSRLEVNPLEIDMSQNGTVADSTAMPRVVIVGGGFGGVAVAKGLKNVPVRITLLDKTNYHLFQPLLYQVATGILEPGTISTPIRSLFRHQKNVDVRMAEVTSVDKERRIVHLDGGAESVPYDYLVLATGAHGSYFGHDDWAPLAPSMKTLADAEFLRRRIIGALERADRTSDPTVREQLLTFVLVGAGPTGCELAGSLAEHFRRIPAEYRNMDPRQAHIILVEAGPRALAAFSEDLAAGAVAKLRSLGVDVRLGKAVEQVDEDGVIIAGERVATRTVLWTAGVAASPAGQWLDVESDRAGRVVVGTDLSITGYPEIFVVGDTAHIENDGKMLPGVAQVALQSGKHAAHSIRARVLHQPPPGPFAYFDKGNMATISFTYAIMEKDKVKMRGPLGKLAWTFIHILYLGRAEGQLMLCMQWLFGLVLGRPASRYIDTPSAEVVERVVSAVPEDAAGEVSV